MFYPIKFFPVCKNCVWGGRNLEKFGKELPHGMIGESWEVSCHKDGLSIISNGAFRGMLFKDVLMKMGRQLLGHELTQKHIKTLPLLVKFIDANEKLSLQVHPGCKGMHLSCEGYSGKDEMWYILWAKPGAELKCGIKEGVTKEDFKKAVYEDCVEDYVNTVKVSPGDTFFVPSGTVHSIGEGIVLTEIQQSSNAVYRIYDYHRLANDGRERALHIEKAIDSIKLEVPCGKYKGIEVDICMDSLKRYLICNKYFCVEHYTINGEIQENADGKRFCIYSFIDGYGKINYPGGQQDVTKGETVFIPASMGHYVLRGQFKALKTYVPNIAKSVLEPLLMAGYSLREIFDNVGGLA